VNKSKQLFASLVLMALGLETAQAEYKLNLMQGVTKVSNDIYDLHMLILWICVFIGVAVFGTMFYSIYHHRKSKAIRQRSFMRTQPSKLFGLLSRRSYWLQWRYPPQKLCWNWMMCKIRICPSKLLVGNGNGNMNIWTTASIFQQLG